MLSPNQLILMFHIFNQTLSSVSFNPGLLRLQIGSNARPLAVDITVRALCADINRLDAARASKDQLSIKRMEETLSTGLVLLSKILNENLTIHRECVLTAFSLTPTNNLFQKVSELAEKSEFIKLRPNTNEPLEQDEEKRKQHSYT